MNRRRQRRYGEARKPISPIGLASAIGAGISILVWIAMMLFSIYSEGNISNLWSGISMLAMIMAVVTLVSGTRESKDEMVVLPARIVGAVMPFIATLLWLGIYIVGLFI